MGHVDRATLTQQSANSAKGHGKFWLPSPLRKVIDGRMCRQVGKGQEAYRGDRLRYFATANERAAANRLSMAYQLGHGLLHAAAVPQLDVTADIVEPVEPAGEAPPVRCDVRT